MASERSEPVVVLDSESRIRDHNQPARALFPALRGAFDRPLDDVLPAVAAHLASEASVLELSRDGTSRYYHVQEHSFGVTRSGRGGSLVFADVTDRERYRRALERQNERLDGFADVVSHDLRNPLNVAQGRIDLALEAVDGEDANLAAAADALDRMEAIIDDVLTLARQGQSVDEIERISLAPFVERCWQMVETDAATLVVETDLTVEAAPDRLQRLFENLFRNAVEHGSTGGRTGSGDAAERGRSDVTVTVGSLADRTGFYVADDGPGIPADRRASVFEYGYTTNATGTGFGLAIVAEIVEAHGWEITATEGADGGARFEISGVNADDERVDAPRPT